MEEFDYIDDYFLKKLTPEDARIFEERLQTDSDFADKIAFYLSAKNVLTDQAEKNREQRFREIYQNQTSFEKTPVLVTFRYIAIAAVVCGIIFGIYILARPVSPRQLADNYFQNNLNTLSVQMGTTGDELQVAIGKYNNDQISAALDAFDKIIASDSTNFTAIRFAGISALKLKKYNKALEYFQRLSNFTTLYSNPALFLQSLTLMERNGPGDLEKAKKMLQQIVDLDLEGREIAQQWLSKL